MQMQGYTRGKHVLYRPVLILVIISTESLCRKVKLSYGTTSIIYHDTWAMTPSPYAKEFTVYFDQQCISRVVGPTCIFGPY